MSSFKLKDEDSKSIGNNETEVYFESGDLKTSENSNDSVRKNANEIFVKNDPIESLIEENSDPFDDKNNICEHNIRFFFLYLKIKS